jgi:ornithine carbamoyltransferase
MTYEEHCGPVAGKKIAWVGDGNNVCNSFVAASAPFGFSLSLACPPELMPDAETIAWAQAHGGKVTMESSPQAAAKGAHLVVTDTWVSMGDSDGERSRKLLEPYQVNEALMELADKKAVFMHCLPAHRAEEVTGAVIDGEQSVVWDEAENRLHVQKAILLWCLGKL